MATSNCFRIHIRRISSIVNNELKYTHLLKPKITPPRQAWSETFVYKDKQLLDIKSFNHKCLTTNRHMSYDSSNNVHKRINDLITNSKKRVFLFMKGVPKEPSCRYSGLVVQILDAYGVDFDSFDVLEDQDVRQELKNYSDWPTIPQVFVDGSFVGGCDILLQMHQSGELKDLFKTNGPESTKTNS